ncbi:type 4 pilus major pilin [Amorphus sp. 3PC139-8]|uniref:type 4 pilus major pilin n=1 Tax=Amorphus sp. 3PC139-8 TaxID=2735676 RepID=UPI00345DF12B
MTATLTRALHSPPPMMAMSAMGLVLLSILFLVAPAGALFLALGFLAVMADRLYSRRGDRATVDREMPSAAGLRSIHQRGISLMEAVLYIVIALSVIVGGIVFFGQASLSSRVNDAIRTLMSLQSETRAMHQTSADFGAVGTDITPALVNSGAIQGNLERAGGAVVNQWEGQILVTGNDQEFAISYDDVPDDACTRLVPYDTSGMGQGGTGIIGVTVEAATATPDTDIANADTDGITPVDAAGLCVNGGNSITWHFSRT